MDHEIFSENITGPWNIEVYGLLTYEIFFEKLVKPSGALSYILNVRSLANNWHRYLQWLLKIEVYVWVLEWKHVLSYLTGTTLLDDSVDKFNVQLQRIGFYWEKLNQSVQILMHTLCG